MVNGTGGGVFESGATIVLTPKNSDGKRFVGWTVDGIPVSDGETDENNALTITVNRNATYVAVFEDTAD